MTRDASRSACAARRNRTFV